MAKEVHVHRWPVCFARPDHEQHGSLEYEIPRVLRNGKAIEEPFRGVARPDEIRIISGISDDIEKSLANRRRDVRWLVLGHKVASM